LTGPLIAVWRHARWAFMHVATFHTTPRDLALAGLLSRADHRAIGHLVRRLELLTRRLVLVAALALNLVLRPIANREHPGGPRRRRRVLLWPDKPQTWRVRFHVRPPRRPAIEWIYRRRKILPRTLASLPLAKRLEAVRRVLVDPDGYIRRCAIRFARIAEKNRTANQPRCFGVRPWSLNHEWRATPAAARLIATGMAVIQPLAEDAVERFNQAADPG